MTVLTICNRKGGTGKTTTVVNLARFLVLGGAQVLLIDLDTQQHVRLGLGAEPCIQSPWQAASPVPEHRRWANLFVCETGPQPGLDVNLFIHWITGCQAGYDYVLIDTPPTNDVALNAAVRASDAILVPFVATELGAAGVHQLTRLFIQIAQHHNPQLRLLGLLPTMYDRRLKLHQQIIKQMQHEYGAQRVLRPVRNNIKLAEAFSAHQPIYDYAKESSGAMDYQLLADDITAMWSGA